MSSTAASWKSHRVVSQRGRNQSEERGSKREKGEMHEVVLTPPSSKMISWSGKNFCWWHICENENATMLGWSHCHWLLMGKEKISLRAQFSGLSIFFIPTRMLHSDIHHYHSISHPLASSSTHTHTQTFRHPHSQTLYSSTSPLDIL